MKTETPENSMEMEERRFTLRKATKLRHRTLVEGLFSGGESLYEYPLRVVWRRIDGGQLENSFRCGVPDKICRFQFLITVPKKKRRHAVDRVLMRRRIREALRLNRMSLTDRLYASEQPEYLEAAFIYIGDRNHDYSFVERKMKSLLSKIEKKLGSTEQAVSEAES